MVRAMNRLSAGWRVGAAAAALAVLCGGQALDTNDWFPLGSLSQYSSARDLDSTVARTVLEMRFAGDAEFTPVGISHGNVGIVPGDLDSHLGALRRDPSLLEPLARNYAELHPDAEAIEEIRLRRRIHQLENGRAVGEPTFEDVALLPVAGAGDPEGETAEAGS